MAQGTPQFTPAQILEAGRRAEADGRLEYAIQFYRHLTDHHARSQEASSARDALGRLTSRRAPEAVNGSHAAAPSASNSAYEAAPGAAGQQSPPATSPAQPHDARRGPPATPGTAIAIAPMGAKRRQAIALPPATDHYRFGRFVAALFIFVGWLLVAVGIIGAGLAIATIALPGSTAVLARYGGALVVSPVFSGSGLLSGLVLVLLGQLARAVFDAANATRDLAAIGRARHEHAQG